MRDYTVATGLRLRGVAEAGQVPEQYVDDVRAKYADLLSIAATFTDRANAAQADRTLSADGVVVVVGRAASEGLAALTAFERRVVDVLASRLQSTRAAVLRKIEPARPSGGTIEADLYVANVMSLRSQIAGLGEPERIALYMGAEDPLVLDAIESAPPILIDGKLCRLVPADLVEERRSERARAAAQVSQPDQVSLLDDLERLRGLYALAVAELRRDLLTFAPEAPVAVPAAA